MGWYLQGQDPSGRVGGAASGRKGGNLPEAAEEGRQRRPGHSGGQLCVIMPGAGQCWGDVGNGAQQSILSLSCSQGWRDKSIVLS